MNFHLLTWIDSTNPTAGGISGTSLATNQFAEFGINLTQALGLGGKCFAFPQQVWESRSSGSSFTSNPQDIEIEHHIIQNCGEVQIIKQTDPRGQDQDVGFSSTIPSPGTSNPATPNCTRSHSNPSSFTLNDSGNAGKTLGSTDPADNSAGNTQDCTNVVQGTYTVTEDTEPGAFSFESLACSVTGTGGTTATTSGTTATINLKPGKHGHLPVHHPAPPGRDPDHQDREVQGLRRPVGRLADHGRRLPDRRVHRHRKQGRSERSSLQDHRLERRRGDRQPGNHRSRRHGLRG